LKKKIYFLNFPWIQKKNPSKFISHPQIEIPLTKKVEKSNLKKENSKKFSTQKWNAKLFKNPLKNIWGKVLSKNMTLINLNLFMNFVGKYFPKNF
jgi:hypothetical protein